MKDSEYKVNRRYILRLYREVEGTRGENCCLWLNTSLRNSWPLSADDKVLLEAHFTANTLPASKNPTNTWTMEEETIVWEQATCIREFSSNVQRSRYVIVWFPPAHVHKFAFHARNVIESGYKKIMTFPNPPTPIWWPASKPPVAVSSSAKVYLRNPLGASHRGKMPPIAPNQRNKSETFKLRERVPYVVGKAFERTSFMNCGKTLECSSWKLVRKIWRLLLQQEQRDDWP